MIDLAYGGRLLPDSRTTVELECVWRCLRRVECGVCRLVIVVMERLVLER